MKTLLLLVISLSAWSTTVWADEDSFKELFQKRAVLGAGQVVHGDYFAIGPHVEISGTVNGDVYAAGGEVLVDGTVNGDVIVGGGHVTISGTVAQDARVAGGQVTIGGKIGRNLTVAGGDLQVTDSAQVHDNLLAGGGNVLLAGRIGKDARVGGGNVTVSNAIERDLTVAAGEVRLTSKATVGGILRYWNETAPSIDEGATVRGGVIHRPLPESFKAERFREGFSGVWIVAKVVSFASTLLLGLLLIWVYPVFCRAAAVTIQERPGLSLMVGLLTVIGTPLMILICLVTVVGIPIGLILGVLSIVTLYIGRIFVMVWAGGWVLKRLSDSPSLGWAFVTGLVLYAFLSLLPVVGKLVTLLTMLIGVGALLIAKKELIVRLREQQVV